MMTSNVEDPFWDLEDEDAGGIAPFSDSAMNTKLVAAGN